MTHFTDTARAPAGEAPPRAAAATAAAPSSPQLRTGRRRARPRDLLNVTAQLAIMTRTGIDIASAVRTVAAQCRNERLRGVLEEVHQDVANGQTVSAALGRHGAVFGRSFVAAVASAEASGGLSDTLARLGDQLRHEIRHRSTVRQLLAYPVLLTGVSSMVLLGLVLFVLPQFAQIYEQYHMPLPWTTRLLLDAAETARGALPLLALAAAAAATGAAVLWLSQFGARLRDRAVLHASLIREVTRPLTAGRLLSTLGNMLHSGVPLLEGVRLSRDAVANSLFQKLMRDVEQQIVNGQGIRRPVQAASFLPDGAAEMLVTGEQTGTLDEVTAMMGEFYQEQGEAKLRELTAVAEPVIIVLMGVVVGFVVISVMLPIFDMSTIVR